MTKPCTNQEWPESAFETAEIPLPPQMPVRARLVFLQKLARRNLQQSVFTLAGAAHRSDHLAPLAEALAEKDVATYGLDLLARHNCVGTKHFSGALTQAVQYCNQQNLHPDGIVGHSYGGELVQRLDPSVAPYKKSLLAPIPLEGGRENLPNLWQLACHRDVQQLLSNEELYKNRFCSSSVTPEMVHDIVQKLEPFPLKSYIDIARQPNPNERQKKEKAPTQLIIGDEDAIFPVEAYPRLRLEMTETKGFEYIVTEGSHNFYRENPDETAAHIARFLQD